MRVVINGLIWSWIIVCFTVIPVIGLVIGCWVIQFFTYQDLWMIIGGGLGTCFGAGIGTALAVQAMDWLDD
jgi:hypothetical protein